MLPSSEWETPWESEPSSDAVETAAHAMATPSNTATRKSGPTTTFTVMGNPPKAALLALWSSTKSNNKTKTLSHLI